MEGLSAPICLTPWDDFVMNPSLYPGLFKNTPGDVTPDTNKVIYLEQGKDNPKSGVMEVSTEEELDELIASFKSKVLFTKIYLSHQQNTSHQGARVNVMEIQRWQGYYATLFNLGHPEIWKQIEPSLKKAQEAMKKGKKFCVEICCWPSINEWYTDKLHGRMMEGLNANWRTVCMFATFNITNSTIYNHCFDCNLCWCCLCCVCWLFSAPCYRCGRSCTTDDMQIMVKAKVTTKELVVARQAQVVTRQF